jgi:hypothetical protein
LEKEGFALERMLVEEEERETELGGPSETKDSREASFLKCGAELLRSTLSGPSGGRFSSPPSWSFLGAGEEGEEEGDPAGSSFLPAEARRSFPLEDLECFDFFLVGALEKRRLACSSVGTELMMALMSRSSGTLGALAKGEAGEEGSREGAGDRGPPFPLG